MDCNEMSDRPPFWERMTIPALVVLGFVGNGIWQEHTSLTAQALTFQDVAELKATVHDIQASLIDSPALRERISQLEHWRNEAQGMFGALDGRLRTVEDTSSRNSTDIANLKPASGVKLR